jgi:hypothetical protein
MPVGILFQNPDNQMVSVTVEKEIAFALENLAVPQPEMERLITETLERFSITHLRSRLTSELSGGEKQRVALAGVMVTLLSADRPGRWNGRRRCRAAGGFSGQSLLHQDRAELFPGERAADRYPDQLCQRRCKTSPEHKQTGAAKGLLPLPRRA